MQKNSILDKTLVVGVIILFIGVYVQPAFAFNVNSSNDLNLKNESNNINKVEYIIQIVRTDEIIKHKVTLTEEVVTNLESLFEQIRADLNNSESKEETTKIYNDAADSFRNFGLLPEDISVNEIKQLMTGSNRDLDNIRYKKEMGNGFENRFCFVAGKTTLTFSVGPVIFFSILGLAFLSFLDCIHEDYDISEKPILDIIYTAFCGIIWLPLLPLLILSIPSVLSIIPVSLGSIITLGNTHWEPPYNDVDTPSKGWIRTIGLNGKRSYDGSFYGQLGEVPFLIAGYYIGITGFTGVNIRNIKTDKVFYLGFALHVKIDTRP